MEMATLTWTTSTCCVTPSTAAESDPLFDLNGSGAISVADLDELIQNILHTSYGDANLDGRFNSEDFVEVFQAGQYEDTIEDNSNWATGDWNADREFDSADFVRAFQMGTYEQPAAVADRRTPRCRHASGHRKTADEARENRDDPASTGTEPTCHARSTCSGSPVRALPRGTAWGLRGAAGSLEEIDLKDDCVGPELPLI